MADHTIKDARTFLWAVKESFDEQFDHDAVEWLELEEQRIFEALDARSVRGRARDRIILYEGMRRGLVLKLRKIVIHSGTEARDKNLLTPDGKVKEH